VETVQQAAAVNGPPWLTGTVYGVLLNYRADLEALGSRVLAPPYLAPPRAPVLYLQPRNTWISDGDDIPLPFGATALQVGATLALIMGRPCTRVREEHALSFIGGLACINDLCLPHEEIFRPAIKERCRDGFCPVGPRLDRQPDDGPMTDRYMRTYVNGRLLGEWNTRDLVRPIARLIADVSEFLTLHTGDVLMVGTPRNAPLARAGDRVAVEVEGVGRIENPIVNEPLFTSPGSQPSPARAPA
jgi:5-oxopent-3-ene-1,2,5-tricarboxylate decarboxylase / 2-hydroxyhepta-2,4-diene-1,7-dioate isomerase